MRREFADARALADTLNHAPKRLLARRHFRVFAFTLPFVLRDPLLDLDREEVVVELRLARQGLQGPSVPVESY